MNTKLTRIDWSRLALISDGLRLTSTRTNKWTCQDRRMIEKLIRTLKIISDLSFNINANLVNVSDMANEGSKMSQTNGKRKAEAMESDQTEDLSVYKQKIAFYESKLASYEEEIASFQEEIAAHKQKLSAYEAKLAVYETEIAFYLGSKSISEDLILVCGSKGHLIPEELLTPLSSSHGQDKPLNK